jgi:leucyl/phenylalanyl-tRNA--protein transferase
LELTPELLISAYAQGVFPMGVDDELHWFSPDPRAILPLDRFHVSRNLGQLCRSGRFEIRISTAFERVMRSCADRSEGTWITDEIVRAYCVLNELGLAHSVEAWRGDQLAGGLYGVVIGGAFFGESMFFQETNASKVALVALVERMRQRSFSLLDIQVMTPHLKRFGAIDVPRARYLQLLATSIRQRCRFVDAVGPVEIQFGEHRDGNEH